MTRNEAELVAARLRLALDLCNAGVDLMRENLRRRFPRASVTQIEERLTAWLHERPGAEYGDAVGRPVAWPRHPTPKSRRPSLG